jgi:hypothetical protein
MPSEAKYAESKHLIQLSKIVDSECCYWEGSKSERCAKEGFWMTGRRSMISEHKQGSGDKTNNVVLGILNPGRFLGGNVSLVVIVRVG